MSAHGAGYGGEAPDLGERATANEQQRGASEASTVPNHRDDEGNQHLNEAFRGSLDLTAKPPRRKLRLLLAAAVGLFALAVVAVGVVLVLGGVGKKAHREVTLDLHKAGMFYEFPPILADLKSESSRPHYLKVLILVEVRDQDRKLIKSKEAEIIASIQGRLREYNRRELIGKAGTERVRADLLNIVNRAIAPAEAQAILFKEFLLD